MENASKALIMAAGVLIGVLILSLASYLIITFGAQSREMHKLVEENQLTQYNAQYNIYVGRKDITIYEIISLASLAEENKQKYENFEEFHVKVSTEGTGTIQPNSRENRNKLLQQYGAQSIGSTNSNLPYFECKDIEYYEKTGRVKSISFRLNNRQNT